jgi:hypothetical protein
LVKTSKALPIKTEISAVRRSERSEIQVKNLKSHRWNTLHYGSVPVYIHQQTNGAPLRSGLRHIAAWAREKRF